MNTIFTKLESININALFLKPNISDIKREELHTGMCHN